MRAGTDGPPNDELRFIAYREFPAPGTGPIEDAVVVVLHYRKPRPGGPGGCLIWAYDVQGQLVEKRDFPGDLAANKYVHRYADDESDRAFMRSDWKWPFTTWYLIGAVDDFPSFIAAEATRGHPATRYRCPCCGYKTFVESGSYETCRVCYWEDDGDARPDVINNVNHITLSEARRNFATVGAYESKWKDKVRPPRAHEL